MVRLDMAPFYLDEEAIRWVEETWKSMTREEKIGQLFVCMNGRHDRAFIEQMVSRYHVGGIRWSGGTLEEIWEQNRLYQELSRIPVLVAANCEAGGNGAVSEGTLAGMPAAIGATEGTWAAKKLGEVCGAEAEAIGCNITFSPLADLTINWRNTIVNLRSFGKDPERVAELCREYMDGVRPHGVACCGKHFPGDGSEERDQHLVMGCNDLSREEWMETYGRVWKSLIDHDLEAVMVGHICQPAWTRYFSPEKKDEEILPATLCPELLQGLLRQELGFNGLILSDASHMLGLTAMMPRREQVPGAIAAGCDMFLFFGDPDEDIRYVEEALESGGLTEERMQEAVWRILGMKAHLGLHHLTFPPKEALRQVGCDAHQEIAREIAEASVTLVKDTQGLLPVSPAEKKRAALFFIQSAPISLTDGPDPARAIVQAELERAGFQVTVMEDYYDMEAREPGKMNRVRIMKAPSVEKFREEYDVAFVFTNMKGYAQDNNVRIRYSASHSHEMPWYVREVPTVFVSLSYTNQLYDLPMAKTYINAYAASRACIRAAVRGIIGEIPFPGKADENVWCERWDTRL